MAGVPAALARKLAEKRQLKARLEVLNLEIKELTRDYHHQESLKRKVAKKTLVVKQGCKSRQVTCYSCQRRAQHLKGGAQAHLPKGVPEGGSQALGVWQALKTSTAKKKKRTQWQRQQWQWHQYLSPGPSVGIGINSKGCNTNGLSKAALWESFLACPFWTDVGAIAKSANNLQPMIKFKCRAGCIYSPPALGTQDAAVDLFLNRPDDEPQFTANEEFDVAALQLLWSGGSRVRNASILVDTVSSEFHRVKKTSKAGFLKKAAQKIADDLEQRCSKLRSMEDIVKKTLKIISTRDSSGEPGRKLRKREKSSCTITLKRTTTYVTGKTWRGRRQGQGELVAQQMDQRLQKILLHNTEDLDIANCVFVLLAQMVKRLDLVDTAPWKQEMMLLDKLASDRAGVCRDDLKVSEAEGKQWLHIIVNGGTPPPEMANLPFMTNLSQLGRFLRWLACSVLPDVHIALRNSKTNEKKWPEASCLSYLWNGVEDNSVQAMASYVSRKPHTHLSLHFDGVRTDKLRCQAEEGADGTATAMCRALEAHVLAETGYKVNIVSKKHQYLRALVRELQAILATVVTSDLLLTAGNCIPLAYAALHNKVDEVVAKVTEGDNASASAPTFRTYRDVQAMLGLQLAPCLTIEDLIPGKWLIHAEDNGRPHCIGLDYTSKQNLVLHDSGKSFPTNFIDFAAILEKSIDKKTVVFFQVKQDGVESISTTENTQVLVDMEAGGGEVFDMDVMGYLKDNPDACPIDEDDVNDEGEVHVMGAGSWRCCP